MLAGTAPARFLAELRLPPGFSPVDPRDLPAFPHDETLRVEIVDFAGVVRPWRWSDTSIDWHEAWGWRIAPDGLALPCDACGRLTRRGYIGKEEAEAVESCDPAFTPICHECDADGYEC
jgi:hypothetical protein